MITNIQGDFQICINVLLSVINKHRKLKNPKISNIFGKTIVPSIICKKCGKNNEKVFKEESIQTLKTLGLIKGMEEHQINI